MPLLCLNMGYSEELKVQKQDTSALRSIIESYLQKNDGLKENIDNLLEKQKNTEKELSKSNPK